MSDAARAAAGLVAEPLSAHPAAGDVVRAALVASTMRLLDHEGGAATGRDPEDVHQARVATRRVRSDLRTFAPLLDREWADALRAELRWLGAELGPVRDAEVLRDRLQAAARELPAEDQPAATALLAPLSTEVSRARRRLVTGLRSVRYRSLRERLIEGSRRPALLETAGAGAASAIPRLARGPWRRLRSAAAAAGPASPSDELHQLRIRAKRSRYAAEAAAPVAGKRATMFARAVAELQDVLGELHDAVVAEEWLRRRGSEDGALDATGRIAAGELIAQQRAAAARARREWPRVWKRVATKELRSWM